MNHFSTPHETILLNMYAWHIRRNENIASLDQVAAFSCGENDLEEWLRALADLIKKGYIARANTMATCKVFLTETGIVEGKKVWDATG